MSAKQDFLKAIWEQPHDDLPRLVKSEPGASATAVGLSPVADAPGSPKPFSLH